jgi:hypothetical protein
MSLFGGKWFKGMTAPRCPGCGWLFCRPAGQDERIMCRACEGMSD